ncbi:AAA family ATPase [Chryseobacterium gambrini]|uniref:Predicted ATP-dependent endonuclease of the OLD family, contains P-loop ATPase and TOPRIM domains n=1 Tax=Chryseobacterium gambrini TaxID=373672 RepID=A0A1N7KML8_9FLAO|nr:AAA family ATPase [Chryseobacterium gambrini]SIS62791.1 Predicted ATP-dependent endonuclease of the OLD family, contains P-loop ATPase and TOPRIM domains [Chryseobacterium gambrini]
MLEIDSIRIINFKSIKDYTFDFKNININSSNTGIFVGLNESGKSAFLEAIYLIDDATFKFINYSEYCNNDAQENSLNLKLYAKYIIKDEDSILKSIISSGSFNANLLRNLKINSITKKFYVNESSIPDVVYSIDFDLENVNLNDYTFSKSYIHKGQQETKTTIRRLNPSVDHEKYIKITKSDIEYVLLEILLDYIKENIPKIQLWKALPEFLIDREIDLLEFIENPNKSIPLRNIFNVFGKSTKEDIKKTVEKAITSPSKREELQDKMSESITKYINAIWKEHKIKIRISINGNFCNVFVEDQDKKYSYFSMTQRSDGFKQFISLILSLSALNEAATLKNNIILIDEPEVHLHPSGIAYMRDELLKIGKNNIVLVSTHSPYLIDVNTPKRHYMVTKRQGETKIEQVDENTNFREDSVLKSAFGLNLYKELLPKKIIIVEGGDDKFLFNYCFNQYNYKNFAIKSAGGASKIPGFASLLSSENLEPIIIFDADKEGKDNKKKIIDNYKDSYNETNVFTIKDLNNDLPDNSTIEDLYPINFFKEFMEKELQVNLTLNTNEAVIIQLKNQNEKIKNDKQKLESLKIKISKEFIKEYKTLEQLQAISRLNKLILEFQKRTVKE